MHKLSLLVETGQQKVWLIKHSKAYEYEWAVRFSFQFSLFRVKNFLDVKDETVWKIFMKWIIQMHSNAT